MDIKKVLIAGGGTLGSQIAWQTAVSGFDVVVYDAFEKGLETSKKFHNKFAMLFESRGMAVEKTKECLSRITYTSDLKSAVQGVDFVSESVPENPQIKAEFYRQLSEAVDPNIIITTNSSTLLPSDFAHYVNNPSRFLALHFANMIWDNNIGEIMGHKETSDDAIEKTEEFARAIGMVPVHLKKEQNGYILNSILLPFCSAGMALVTNGVATPEDVDKTMMVSGFASGPFQILDVVGLETAYNIEIHWGTVLNDKQKLANARFVKENYIDKGKLGIKTGEGFYKYPNPRYKDEDFLM